METTTIYPLDHQSSTQSFYASAQRSVIGDWTVSCQLTAEQYLALDGVKIKIDDATITFKRWTKIVQSGVYQDGSERDGQPYMHQLDRIYVGLGRPSRYGYSTAKLGYIEANEWSGLQPGGNGEIGTICAKLEHMGEDEARAIVSAMRGE